MAENTKKQKKNFLQILSVLIMFVGVVIFVVGFILQFSSGPSVSSFNLFEEQKNYVSVIVTGFMMMFFGGFLNIISGLLAKAKNTTDGSLIGDVVAVATTMQETHERMREPKETYCDYCGTLILENERECPNCGANKTKK